MKALPVLAADLLAAGVVLQLRGLAKGTVLDHRGRVCARGAIGIAVTGTPEIWYSGWRSNERCSAADDAASAVVGDDIGWFNNRLECTVQEVVDALDAAASLALDGMACEDLP